MTSGSALNGLGDRLGDARPDELLGVLQNDPGADHHQHGGVDVGACDGAQKEEFKHRTQHYAQDDGEDDGEEEVHPKDDGEQVHHIGAEGVEFAVAEVDDLHDAEDEGQPDAEQRVGATQNDGIGYML